MKMVSLQLQQEWETMVNHFSGVKTAVWIANNLLRPFLFFMTRSSTKHQKIHRKKIDSVKICFTILLESLKSSGIYSRLDVLLLDFKFTF